MSGEDENLSRFEKPTSRGRVVLGFGLGLACALVLGAVRGPEGHTTTTPSDKPVATSPAMTPVVASAFETGQASYYAARYHGRPTASGEIFDMEKMTAAHRTLPFGTKVKVTRLDDGRSVVVRVNDRGPFVDGRIIDVSLAAARELQMIAPGLAKVSVTVRK